MAGEHAAWNERWRHAECQRLASGAGPVWDLVVVGGGITGAGIFREAARLGLRVLLLEQRDFAWGTSSRSSKMVHGGLRYIAEGDFRLTQESVTERQRLLREAPGLVDPLPFLYPHYRKAFPPPWLFSIVLMIYDVMAGKWNHRFHRASELFLRAPWLRRENLLGAMQFGDAVTDDARLVLRVLREGIRDGGTAINYVAARRTLRDGARVSGLEVEDLETGDSMEIRARVVVNATGAWADRLRGELGRDPVIRPLRGSHLVVPGWRVPVGQAISFRHPEDKRPVFVFPWEGVTVIGTTDLDHRDDLDLEATISEVETDYLLAAANHQLPHYRLTRGDVISTWSGVRPVISSGSGVDPSKEKRDHSIWDDAGMLSVSGGKLTTFRVIGREVLERAAAYLPNLRLPDDPAPVFTPPDPRLLDGLSLPWGARHRFTGRFGADLPAFRAALETDELKPVGGTRTWWSELRWAARNELVVHLDDLLLRRTRIGMLLPGGGAAELDRVRAICSEELGWDRKRWSLEREAYLDIWKAHYGPPAPKVRPPHPQPEEGPA